jgi:hypothetical protein
MSWSPKKTDFRQELSSFTCSRGRAYCSTCTCTSASYFYVHRSQTARGGIVSLVLVQCFNDDRFLLVRVLQQINNLHINTFEKKVDRCRLYSKTPRFPEQIMYRHVLHVCSRTYTVYENRSLIEVK